MYPRDPAAKARSRTNCRSPPAGKRLIWVDRTARRLRYSQLPCTFKTYSRPTRRRSASSSSRPRPTRRRKSCFATIAQLQALQPSFVSVTYGAGGSTRERTHDLIVRIQRETNLTAVSHLTCVCHSMDEMAAILDRYAESGIENILALGGDPPQEHGQLRPCRAMRSSTPSSSSASSASIADQPDARGFGIGVAGFPEGHPRRPTGSRRWITSSARSTPVPTTSARSSSSATTTSTTSASAATWPGIRVPIIAGIMPITSKENLIRMAELALGARVPAKLLRAVDRCEDDPHAVAKVGIHWATEQCRDLLDNQVRGIHFYTLNRSDATRQIYENLGVKDSAALGGRSVASHDS